MNSELAAIDWLGRGWLLLLAFTVAVLLVAALRKPCRHLFGTERAFQLWLLPPLAMLASQLPQGGAKGPAALPAMCMAPRQLSLTGVRGRCWFGWLAPWPACFSPQAHSLAIVADCVAPLPSTV